MRTSSDKINMCMIYYTTNEHLSVNDTAVFLKAKSPPKRTYHRNFDSFPLPVSVIYLYSKHLTAMPTSIKLRFNSSQTWHHINWWRASNLSGKPATSIFKVYTVDCLGPEDEERKLHKTTRNYLPINTASKPRRRELSTELWEPPILEVWNIYSSSSDTHETHSKDHT